MGRSTRPSEQRLATILKRQDPPNWGADYVPGQLATRDEAPSDSRPCSFRCELLRRDLHATSDSEKHAILLGLHLGNPFELNEGRMLVREPRAIRLSEHPRAASMPLVQLRGTVRIAETLGVLHVHPRIHAADPNEPGQTIEVAYPYLGDLLWFFEDDHGPYAVNWTVKSKPEDFDFPTVRRRRRSNSGDKDVMDERARHAIEETYYRDAGVATVRVTGVDIPLPVAHNLRQVYGWHNRKSCLEKEQRTEIVEVLRAHMTMQIPPLETLRERAAVKGCNLHDCLCVFYQAIWRRELRVDLWQPINVNRPLRAEGTDPLVHFGAWFSRGTP